jgi:hypothetical protein
MMNRSELHPVDALLLAAVVTLEAVAVLVVALVALVLAVARWRPAAPAAAAAAPPTPHPLSVVAEPVVEALQPLTVTELRRRARAAGLPRTLSRAGRRDALLYALAGLEVAACS